MASLATRRALRYQIYLLYWYVRCSVYLLSWYERTNTDSFCEAQQVSHCFPLDVNYSVSGGIDGVLETYAGPCRKKRKETFKKEN